MIFLKERLYVIFFTGATHTNISLVFMFASDILTVRSITALLTRLSTVTTVVSYILDEL